MSTMLPRDTEAERQAIGSALIDPSLVLKLSEKLSPSDFSDPLHRATYATIQRMRRDSIPLDIVSISSELESSNAFNEAGLRPTVYLAEVGRAVCTTAHVEHYVGKVKEAALKRDAFFLADTAREHALNGKSSSEIVADLWAGVDDLQRKANGQTDRFSFKELREQNPSLATPIIEGVFRAGETINFNAPCKVGKSWAVYGKILSIVTGRPWLGTFETKRGSCLLVDNELHKSVLASRIPVVAEAMGLFPSDYENDLEVLSLRGRLKSLEDLAIELESASHDVIVLDAKYRFIAEGASENDNAQETAFYNTIDAIAERTGAAIVLVHHTTKGSQADKRVTDVGSGASAQARAADCHLILREHEEDDVYVLDAAVRSFAPLQPMALRWKFPLWLPDSSVDSSKLKGKKTRQEQRQAEKDREATLEIIKALPATSTAIRRQTGYGADRVNRLLNLLEKDDAIEAKKIIVQGNTCEEYHVKETDL